MNWLAIDTSTETASVALSVGDTLISRQQENQRTHARVLLPLIEQLMAEAALSLNQLDAIVFGCGPGSFTGLRIACSIAKGLACAQDIPLIPVSSLDAIAWSARHQLQRGDIPILAVLDARMNEMYWSYFPQNEWQTQAQVSPVLAIQCGEAVVMAGYGIDLYWKDMPALMHNQIKERLTLVPHAQAMIRLAQQAGIHPVSAEQAHPIYVRNKVTQGDSRG